MPATLKTRKPIDKLVAADFAKFPIWEFATDEEEDPQRDETWVRPLDIRTIRKGMWSLSVAADFQTSSGLDVPGFVTISTAEAVDIAPGALLPKGHYLFLHPTDKTARAAVARALGLTLKQTFPLRFLLRVNIGREKVVRSGTFT